MLNEVTQIDGHRVMRPGVKNHPNPEHWGALQRERRDVQRENGQVHCGTCWRTEAECGTFDLHHRHYDNWGHEKLEDVILLCRTCHEAITNRIRSERQTGELFEMEPPEIVERVRHHERETLVVEVKVPIPLPKYRPEGEGRIAEAMKEVVETGVESRPHDVKKETIKESSITEKV